KILQHLSSGHAKRTKSFRANKHDRIRQALSAWYDAAQKNSIHPWRFEASLWLNLLGEILSEGRGLRGNTNLYWGNYRMDWPDPKSFLRDKYRESHLRTIGLSQKLPLLEGLARYLAATKAPRMKKIAEVIGSARLARRAMSMSGYSQE